MWQHRSLAGRSRTSAATISLRFKGLKNQHGEGSGLSGQGSKVRGQVMPLGNTCVLFSSAVGRVDRKRRVDGGAGHGS